MRTVAVVQARSTSTRLPKKILAPVAGTTVIALLLERLALAKSIHHLLVATTLDRSDDELVQVVESLGVSVYRGSNQDVLDRYYGAAKQARADVIVRITGDCPLIDPSVVDAVVDKREAMGADFAMNAGYPDGLDVGVFTWSALETAWLQAKSGSDREHVTPFMSRNLVSTEVICPQNLEGLRWTLDEPEDLKVIRAVTTAFSPQRDFTWIDVLKLHEARPEIFAANRHFGRNEGSRMNTGQKLWRRAKRVIPGGSMLMSKRAELFHPNQWPTYFSRAEGCRVWDLDGREFIDMSLMGVGTNLLGYGRPEVDQAVQDVVSTGNMSTLNGPEEVYLAERLLEMHPWGDMVRFARTGGEANAVAIRIARAASGRDKVAICGYHGWHDWYLAANLHGQENLAGHLLPGLDALGVPEVLQGSVLTFSYNNLPELEELVVQNPEIGVIKMEVSRSTGPDSGYLEGVRQIATRNNIILIFDECTSGFREAFGGLHKVYGVNPDMAIFGKALGNGYAVTAVVGKRAIMEAAQSTFISSTFWTERIGSAAALATLDVMAGIESWETVSRIGNAVKSQWVQLGRKYEIVIDTWGIAALPGFTIVSDKALEYKTLITQEMLQQGILASNSIYVCTEHSDRFLDRYFEALDPIFALIAECQNAGRDVVSLLDGPTCHSGFSRLN